MTIYADLILAINIKRGRLFYNFSLKAMSKMLAGGRGSKKPALSRKGETSFQKAMFGQHKGGGLSRMNGSRGPLFVRGSYDRITTNEVVS